MFEDPWRLNTVILILINIIFENIKTIWLVFFQKPFFFLYRLLYNV